MSPKTLAGVRKVAANNLADPRDVEEIVNDVHNDYLRGKVRKDLLLREAKNRAVDRVRRNVIRQLPPDGEPVAMIVYSSAENGADKDAPTVDFEDPNFAGDHDPGDFPGIVALARLMVRGPYQRVQYARGGRTIANPRRNEDWLVGLLAAKQAYQRLKSTERTALDSLSEGERGRPNEQHREAARSVLERERLVPPKPLKADAE